MKTNVHIKNKKASFEYFLLENFSAGIVLAGTEIKSIRNGKVNLTDSYCAFVGSELFLFNAHIAEYEFGNIYNHLAKRPRKLLLTKRELKKIKNKITEKGLTIIPTELYINDKGLCKVDISIAKGKKLYDKREALKEKTNKQEIRKRTLDY